MADEQNMPAEREATKLEAIGRLLPHLEQGAAERFDEMLQAFDGDTDDAFGRAVFVSIALSLKRLADNAGSIAEGTVATSLKRLADHTGSIVEGSIGRPGWWSTR